MTFTKYLGYRLKCSAFRNIALSLFPAIAVLYETARENPYSQMGNDLLIYKSHTDLGHAATVFFIFAFFIPIFENQCFKIRRDTDFLYSMPLTRLKLTAANYLSGFIQVAFTSSVTFFSAWLYLAIHTDYYDLRPMPLYYLSLLAIGLAIYSVMMFIFNEANTTLDGVIFCALWVIAPSVFMEGVLYRLDRYFAVENYSEIVSGGNLFLLPQNLWSLFAYSIQTNRGDNSYIPDLTAESRAVAVWCAVGILCAAAYFFRMTHKGAQFAGEISDSWFGYKLLIPLWGFSLIASRYYNDITPVFILVGMFIAYVLYRRSLKFKLPDYIILGIGALLPLFKL